jgi:hypothetical protein
VETVVVVTGSTPERFSFSYVAQEHTYKPTRLCGGAAETPLDYTATPTSYSIFALGNCGPVVLDLTKQP